MHSNDILTDPIKKLVKLCQDENEKINFKTK